MKTIASASVVYLIFILSSCKKTAESPLINSENLAGTYALVSMRMSASGVPEQDATATMNQCEKDDLYVLNADHSFNYVDAGLTCDPAGNFSGNWELDGNLISFYGEAGEITRFDGNELEIIRSTSNQGITFKVRSTFRRQ